MSVTLGSITPSENDYEWIDVEVVLIRITTTLVPNGSFPVYSHFEVFDEVGFDAAVCVQKYEPWVVETYNTSVTSPSISRIVEKGNGNTSSPSGNTRGPPIENTRYLNASSKGKSFSIAHDNGVRQMQRVNVEDYYYFPSSTVSSIMPRNKISSNLNKLRR